MTLRRHSFSAPAQLSLTLLSGCLERVNSLSGQVSQLASKAHNARVQQVGESVHLQVLGHKLRSQSFGDLPYCAKIACVEELLDEILTMVVVEKSPQDSSQVKERAKIRVCHQCHAPVDQPVHVGVACGVGRCSLPHWQGCDGDIAGGKDGKGKIWAACLESVTTEESGSESENEKDKIESTNLQKLPTSIEEAAAKLGADIVNLDTSDSSSDDEDLRTKKEELDRLKREVDQQSMLAVARAARAEEKEKKRSRKKAELDRQMKMLRDKQASLSTSLGSGTGSGGPSATGTVPRDLKNKVAEHEAKKNQKAAARKADQKLKEGNGVTMGGIRAIPDVRREVEGYITQLKSIIPTLSSDPTAGGFTPTTFNPESVHDGHDTARTNPTKYVYVAELGRAIPMVESLGDLPLHATKTRKSSRPVPILPEPSDTESECSADEFCSLEPEPGMRFVWKKHEDGRKFFKPVPRVSESPDMIITYQLDKTTGNYEQQLVPKQNPQKKVKSAKSAIKTPVGQTPSNHLYKDHRITHSIGQKVPVRKEERQPTFVSGDPERQGKESRVPTLIQFARDCPVSWTSKVTTSSLNPLLFSWAYIAELLATRTGHAPSLKEGELEARLQHFLSVLEVTLQTTTQSDFASESWKVARLYNQKVQDKIDSGVYTWLDLSQQWGTATLPHELMAANAELAPRITKKTREKSPPKKIEDERKPGICYSWNNSDTRGKCKWELDNDGKKCNRQHICSWCKSELNKTHMHQKTFCKQRLEKEDE